MNRNSDSGPPHFPPPELAPAGFSPHGVTFAAEHDYRRDVDGLRGIAVLAVIAFHAFPNFLPGGFAGVDIFFVISGFLISGILFRNLRENRFSYASFYARRIRRIFPALILVLVPCLIFGWLLTPMDFRQIGLHVASAAGFVANFAFWREAGYFDASAETKPLLHLWSLGIEEQFYIFWPLFLTIAWRRKLNFLVLILIIAASSFALNIHLVLSNPDAAFYSPLARFWELMLGGLLAYLALHRPESLPRGAWVSTTGAVLLALGFLLLDRDRNFPGWWALLPTLGAFLLISAGPENWLNRLILGSRALTSTGLISYPLYLWHWPVLYAIRRLFLYRITGLPATGILLGALLVSFVLSWLTYRFVETPIRFGKFKSKAVAPLVSFMILVAVAGLVTFQTNGFAFRFSPEIMRVLAMDYRSHAQKSYRYGTCFLGIAQGPSEFGNCTDRSSSPHPETILLWGDSFAAHLYPGLRARLTPTVQLTQFTASGCAPVNTTWGKDHPHCSEVNRFVLDYIARTHPDRIILSSAWSEFDWRLIGETIARLHSLGVKRIELIGPVPSWSSGLPVSLFKYEKSRPAGGSPLPRRMSFGLVSNTKEIDQEMARMANVWGVAYFSPYRVLCNNEGCLTILGDSPDTLTAWDTGHLTEASSIYVVAQLDDSLLN